MLFIDDMAFSDVQSKSKPKEFDFSSRAIHNWTKAIESKLLSELVISKLDFVINGSVENRIPNNLNISIKGKVAEQLFNFLPNFALSSGSACTSGTIERSHVLSALTNDESRIDGSFRISTGRDTTKEEIKKFIKTLINVIKVKWKLFGKSKVFQEIGYNY